MSLIFGSVKFYLNFQAKHSCVGGNKGKHSYPPHFIIVSLILSDLMTSCTKSRANIEEPAFLFPLYIFLKKQNRSKTIKQKMLHNARACNNVNCLHEFNGAGKLMVHQPSF